jgi:peroxiredoxin
MKIRSLFFWLAFAMFTISTSAQQDYQIKFRIKGIKDTTCLIANYYGNGTYIKDTLKVDGSGRCTFKAPSDLPRGVYIFIITDKFYFDFIVNNDKRFSMETDKQNPLAKMVITGSPENKLFYDYLDFNKLKYDSIQALQLRMKKAGDNRDSVAMLSAGIGRINQEIISYKLDLVKREPSSFIAFMINAMKEPEIPATPILPGGRRDSTFAYNYYTNHFWDGTDFTDDRVLRTPVFHNKLKKYFSSVLIQVPDTIIKASDNLIDKARGNPEMFKYLVWFSTYTFENSDIMGFDAIFVHVADRYYATGEATWVSKTTSDNIVKKANRLRPLLIGKKAPEMIMVDTSNQLVSMHNIRAKFLILLFWDPDCGHCEQEIPAIRDFYQRYKEDYGLEVLAICSDTSLVKWKKAIRKNNMSWINVDGPRSLSGNYHEQYDITTTPEIYILNEEKEIIAKHLRHDQIELFIKNQRQKKTNP